MNRYWIKLGEIFIMIIEKTFTFTGLSVMSVSDLLQLPPVKGKLIFSQFSDKDSMKHLWGLQVWYLFKYAKLTKVVRQNKLFIDLCNKVRVGNIDDDVENLIKARFIWEPDENYSKDALHKYVENEPAMKKNEAVLNELSGERYTTESHDKIPDTCKCPLVLTQTIQNQSKQTQEV